MLANSLFTSMEKITVLMMFIYSVAPSSDVLPKELSPCGKAAKAESYLETAAAMIDKVRENFPDAEGSNCDCPPRPMDCEEVRQCGQNRSGVYQIWPRNRIMTGSISVYCDMDTDGGSWTLIQRRGDFKRPPDFFNKGWQQYKTGFGDLRRDFWLGNDYIYALTNQKKYYLRIDLWDSENTTRYAFYDQFWIDNENQKYRLHVHDFSGTAGDSLQDTHDGQFFTTLDRDNDSGGRNCAEVLKGGWWYKDCAVSNLNGYYGRSETVESIAWLSWDGKPLTMTEMKIRPGDFKTSLLDMDVDPK